MLQISCHSNYLITFIYIIFVIKRNFMLIEWQSLETLPSCYPPWRVRPRAAQTLGVCNSSQQIASVKSVSQIHVQTAKLCQELARSEGCARRKIFVAVVLIFWGPELRCKIRYCFVLKIREFWFVSRGQLRLWETGSERHLPILRPSVFK